MSTILSPKLRGLGGGVLTFWCPGCNERHAISCEAPGKNGARWSYNGNPDKPTFSPSVLVRSGHYVDGDKASCWCTYNAEHPDEPDKFHCVICHSFVKDGRIQFLSDCTHPLAGQTVDLPDFPERAQS